MNIRKTHLFPPLFGHVVMPTDPPSQFFTPHWLPSLVARAYEAMIFALVSPLPPPHLHCITLRCGNSGAEGGRRGLQLARQARLEVCAAVAVGLPRLTPSASQAAGTSLRPPERASPRAAQTARELGCAHKQPCRSSYHLLFSPPPRSTSRVMLSHRPTSPPTDLPDILTTQLLQRG